MGGIWGGVGGALGTGKVAGLLVVLLRGPDIKGTKEGQGENVGFGCLLMDKRT